MLKLALFDLDHTLLNIDSDHAWGEFLIQEQLVDVETYRKRNDQFYQDYQAGTLDAKAYQEFVFEFLRAHELPYLAQLHQQFMQSIIIPAMRPLAIQAIEQHRAAGHELILISATNNFVVEPIAAAFGISHVLSSIAEQKNGRYTGSLQGVPCFQAGKLEHLNQWLQGREVAESWGYSDSHNDIPLLKFVTYPVAVSPDAALHAYALAHHWSVEDWAF